MAGEWVKAVEEAFDDLTPPHLEKKKATIIALVDARLAGKPEESVWKLPEVCNRGTYHLRWKHDPAFAACLEAVTRLARQWKDGRTVRALQEAAERLALAAPVAVGKVLGLLTSEDENVRLRAALAILDRAGVETATKAETHVEGQIGLDPAAVDRLDQALMATMYEDGDEGRRTEDEGTDLSPGPSPARRGGADAGGVDGE